MRPPALTHASAAVFLGDCLDVLAEMPDNSVDSIVTDPPYGLGFMGKAWDDLPPGLDWARECLRVLKPGGHLLAFGGSRTWHRLAVAIEDAGFEMRDSIAWLYGSGFPKSMDVSKAIDKARRRDYVLAAVALGLSIPGNNLHDWTKAEHSPGDAWWGRFKEHLSPEEWGAIERQVIRTESRFNAPSGIVSAGQGERTPIERRITAPATPAAQQWSGWGTALKPAFEPIVVARKPLVGTVAANVLQHRTGALNIDGTRVGGDAGRWPTNVVLDGDAADELDEQSGVTKSGRRKAGTYGLMGYMGADAAPMPEVVGDSGGASRFFPTFRYQAKAPTRERPVIVHDDGTKTAHPTVKPLALMRWLVRLVTPAGGTVLDTFAGSGATIEAAVQEGFYAMGIEREEDYLQLIQLRLDRVTAPEDAA